MTEDEGEGTMLLTLIFIAATLFFANKAKKVHAETGEPHWFSIGCAALSLVLSVVAATKG